MDKIAFGAQLAHCTEYSAELRTCAVRLDDHGAGLSEVGDAALQMLPFAQQAEPFQALLAVGNLWDVHDIQAPCPSDPPLAATM